MAARSRGGANGEDDEPVARWRAEEAVAGNRMALQALRELVIYPFLYARQSRLLGLKVLPPVPFSSSPPISSSDGPSVTNLCSLCCVCLHLQWPRGLLLYGPPGTGKVWHSHWHVLILQQIDQCGSQDWFLFFLSDKPGSSHRSRMQCPPNNDQVLPQLDGIHTCNFSLNLPNRSAICFSVCI